MCAQLKIFWSHKSAHSNNLLTSWLTLLTKRRLKKKQKWYKKAKRIKIKKRELGMMSPFQNTMSKNSSISIQYQYQSNCDGLIPRLCRKRDNLPTLLRHSSRLPKCSWHTNGGPEQKMLKYWKNYAWHLVILLRALVEESAIVDEGENARLPIVGSAFLMTIFFTFCKKYNNNKGKH